MSEIKWIKITTNIFDDEKILLIESMPDADSIIVIWFKLLILAGKQNNLGIVTLSDKIAYTDEMLATIFRRNLNTVRLALDTFERFGMIEIVDGVITIPNWEKHQNIDGLEKIKEQNRDRVRRYRERQKTELLENKVDECNVTVTLCNAIEEDKEKDKEKEDIVDTFIKNFHEICISYRKVQRLNDKRKKAILKLYKKYSNDEILTVLHKSEESDFLTGRDKDSRSGEHSNWVANFDWIINENNFVKILDGNYDNHGGTSSNRRKFGETSGISSEKVTKEELANGYLTTDKY